MSDAVEFVVELEERVSRPAKIATGAVGAFISKLEVLRGVLEKVETRAGKAEGRFSGLVESFARLGSKPAAIWDLGSAAVFAGGELLKLAAAGGAFALGITAYALHAADFQQKTLAALRIVEGTATAAQETFGLLRTMSNNAGLPTEQVVRFYDSLREVGYQAQTAGTLVAAALDVGAINPGAADALTSVFAHIGATGKFDRRAVRAMLRGTHISEDDLAETLSGMEGAFKGQTVAAIRAAMEAGQVPAATGVEAIVATINRKFDQGGGVGGAAINVQGRSLAGGLATLKNQIDDLLGDSIVLGPFTNALGQLNTLLDGSTSEGQHVRQVLGGAFGQIAGLLSGLDATSLANVVSQMASLVAITIRGTAAFAAGLSSGLRPFLAVIKGVGEVLGFSSGEGNGFVAMLGAAGKIIGFVAGIVGTAVAGIIAIIMGVVAAVEWVVDKIGGFKTALLVLFGVVLGPLVALWAALEKMGPLLGAMLDWIVDAFVSFGKWIADGARAIGQAIVDGITGGATANLSKVATTFADVGQKAIDAARGTLQVHSPSRVFEGIGRYTVAGFVEGVRAEDESASDAMARAMSPPALPSVAPSGASSAGRSVSFGDINIHITIEGASSLDNDALAEEVAHRARRELLALFDELGLSAGAAMRA